MLCLVPTITAGLSRSGHKQHLIAVFYCDRMNFLLMRNSIDFIFVKYFFLYVIIKRSNPSCALVLIKD